MPNVAALSYRTQLGVWWRRRRIQNRLIAAWADPFLAALGRARPER